MNVLVHGDSLWCSLDLYEGRNDIRLLGFTGAPHHHYRYDPLSESAADVVDRVSRQWPPELLLCWYPEVTPPPFAIEECPIQTAAVISDWNLAYALLEKNLTRFDVVLCDKPGVTVFRRNGVNAHHPFPIYSQDSRVHHPYPVEKDIDVVMVGNLNHAAHATRARYLERLAKLSDQYRIVIATNFVGEAYGMLLSRARIVFNHSIRSELNMRFFETLACGSLAFLEESNSEVGDWCRDGHEVVLYNEQNFEEKLHYYLAHPNETQAITARGHALAASFAGEHKFDGLVDFVARQGAGTRCFHELAEAERAVHTVLLYTCPLWPGQRPLEERVQAAHGQLLQDNPRFWTALGRSLLRRAQESGDSGGFGEAFKVFLHAQRLEPESGPYALNAERISAMCGYQDRAAGWLERALTTESLTGQQDLVGGHGDPFWLRWIRAVAEQRADLPLFHAECYVRLGLLLAGQGHVEPARKSLEAAYEMDPANVRGIRTLAELYWVSGECGRAADFLHRHLVDLPFDFDARKRLAAMWRELGRAAQADELDRESECMQQALVVPDFAGPGAV